MARGLDHQVRTAVALGQPVATRTRAPAPAARWRASPPCPLVLITTSNTTSGSDFSSSSTPRPIAPQPIGDHALFPVVNVAFGLALIGFDMPLPRADSAFAHQGKQPSARINSQRRPMNSERPRRPYQRSWLAIRNAFACRCCVVRLMWLDDLDTAFRHLDLYDRFGCPGGHVQAAFRCSTPVRCNDRILKVPETLSGRVQACWINPSAQPQAASSISAPAPAAPAPQSDAARRQRPLRPRQSSCLRGNNSEASSAGNEPGLFWFGWRLAPENAMTPYELLNRDGYIAGLTFLWTNLGDRFVILPRWPRAAFTMRPSRAVLCVTVLHAASGRIPDEQKALISTECCRACLTRRSRAPRIRTSITSPRAEKICANLRKLSTMTRAIRPVFIDGRRQTSKYRLPPPNSTEGHAGRLYRQECGPQ